MYSLFGTSSNQLHFAPKITDEANNSPLYTIPSYYDNEQMGNHGNIQPHGFRVPQNGPTIESCKRLPNSTMQVKNFSIMQIINVFPYLRAHNDDIMPLHLLKMILHITLSGRCTFYASKSIHNFSKDQILYRSAADYNIQNKGCYSLFLFHEKVLKTLLSIDIAPEDLHFDFHIKIPHVAKNNNNKVTDLYVATKQ